MKDEKVTTPRKLTKDDLPELAEDSSEDFDTFYCRHFVADGSGWLRTACTDRFSSESACASATPPRGDGPERSYSWTRNEC